MMVLKKREIVVNYWRTKHDEKAIFYDDKRCIGT